MYISNIATNYVLLIIQPLYDAIKFRGTKHFQCLFNRDQKQFLELN